MRVFITTLCLLASAYAKPQAGYNYQNQQSSYQQNQQHNSFQVNSISGGLAASAPSFLQQALTLQNSKPSQASRISAPTKNYIPPATSYIPPATNNIPPATSYIPPAVGSSHHQQQQQQFGGFQPSFGIQKPSFNTYAPQYKQQYQHQQQQHQGGYNQQQQSSLVTKDIYVHVAPEEHEEQHYQGPVLPPPPPRKHYRIVFIKAPTPKVNKAAVRITQAPAEEKTIIYVLTRKPDPIDLEAAYQEAPAKQPSKPEVYFIKYRTQEEARHAQQTIQAQYDQLGGTTQISDEGVAPVTSVIGSLDQQHGGHSGGAISSSSSSSSSSSVSSSSSAAISSSSGSGSGSNGYLPPLVRI